jgi:pyruvate, water dikinase
VIPQESSIDGILRALQERTKELDCLYKVDEILKATDLRLPEMLGEVVAAIPPGYQFPAICIARITYRDTVVQSPNFVQTPWVQSAIITVDAERAGKIEVFYREQVTKADEGPFLKEERKLLSAIAVRIGYAIGHKRMQTAFENLQTARQQLTPASKGQWRVILDFLKHTDQRLLLRISRKMLNHLCWVGIQEAVDLLHSVGYAPREEDSENEEDNRPLESTRVADVSALGDATFTIAAAKLSEEEILRCVQKWIREERARFLVNAVANPDASLDEVTDAIRRFHHIPKEEVEFPPSVQKGLPVSLIEHFFTDMPAFMDVAKRWIGVDDYFDLVQRMIFPPKSRGKLGGKSAGLNLAMSILRKSPDAQEILSGLKVPRTWYITTDGLLDFIQFNSLEDVYNQKYADIDQVRYEYPHLVQMFKNSQLSPAIVKGLSVLLDDIEGVPLIVRSSSLLEDRFGAAFSGKYKSLFLANQGTKPERLAALMDAIAEVYASTFGPDPIEYRAERGLIDVYEEMGILIQEVVGVRVGRHFLPAFSGVAFSRNEFRWSSRIRREDGLVRLVPGLGTRAVDRLKDDYPVLMAPGQPNLRVNITIDEIVRYSPKKVDLINLETGSFDTVDARDLLAEIGPGLPQFHNMVSVIDGDRIRRPLVSETDVDPSRLVFTFEGLVGGTPFIRQIRKILEILEREIGSPVDIEFASDGKDLYLLQCRPQSSSGAVAPATLPRDLPEERILFSARKFVSNGTVPNITHVVYVDPGQYALLPTLEDLRAIGRAVGKLNKILPKRQFILMGPGRWGSRGDIKLGVNVTYADINNTAALIEIARKKGNYLPDLSFGTHFFQDLVEAHIRYLPLYPDDEGIVFNEGFLRLAPSLLVDLLPEAAGLADTLRVIDIPRVSDGMILRLLMNAETDEALAFFSPPQAVAQDVAVVTEHEPGRNENHWRWRLRFAERLAAELDGLRFGVKAFYVIGSTKNATAGPASDIDILLHFTGTDRQRTELLLWLEGWSECLGEINFLRTGYRTAGLLDVHLITDEDIAARSSFAVKIGAVTDPARELPLKTD